MKTIKLIIVSSLLIFLSGCITAQSNQISNDNMTVLEAVTNMWNYDYSKDKIDWKQQAEFYRDNYPKSSNGEKVKMLTDSMTASNEKFTTTTKTYTITVTSVYDKVGQQIWPILDNNKTELENFSDNMSSFADTMEELDDRINTKQESK